MVGIYVRVCVCVCVCGWVLPAVGGEDIVEIVLGDVFVLELEVRVQAVQFLERELAPTLLVHGLDI